MGNIRKVYELSDNRAEYDFHFSLVRFMQEVIDFLVHNEELSSKVLNLKLQRRQLILDEKKFIKDLEEFQKVCVHDFSIHYIIKLCSDERKQKEFKKNDFLVNVPKEYTRSKICIHCGYQNHKEIHEIMFPKCSSCWDDMELVHRHENSSESIRFPAGTYKCKSCGKEETLWKDHK